MGRQKAYTIALASAVPLHAISVLLAPITPRGTVAEAAQEVPVQMRQRLAQVVVAQDEILQLRELQRPTLRAVVVLMRFMVLSSLSVPPVSESAQLRSKGLR